MKLKRMLLALASVAAGFAVCAPAMADLQQAKVMKGGSGTWGPVPMPANPQVSADEAKKLVTWILAQK